jgi:hypothetical protein
MSRQFARRALVVPVTASLLLASAACDDDDGAARDTEPEEVSVAELESIEEGLAAGDQRISEIADDLEDDDEGFEEPDLLGEAVSVTGEVTTVLDGNGFVLDGDEGARQISRISSDGALTARPSLPAARGAARSVWSG